MYFPIGDGNTLSCFGSRICWHQAIGNNDLFPAPREKYSELFTAQPLRNCIKLYNIYLFHSVALH